MAKVFLCYRRDDSAAFAGRVRDRLDRDLGHDLLFMDVDAIPLGACLSIRRILLAKEARVRFCPWA
jgi:hypothetical protein